MTSVIVVGGAGQGRQVIDAIEARGEHVVVGVLDRTLAIGSNVAGYKVLGNDTQFRACATASGAKGFVVAIGDNFTRGALLDRLGTECPDMEACTVVHPSAVVARDAVIGAASILLAGAIVSNSCVVGRGVLFGTKSSVDHDCELGDHASLAPAATTAGTVRIGCRTALGVGANVIHGVTIGSDSVIGAGALVLADLPDRVVAYGAPAQVRRSRTPDERYL